MIKKVSNLTHTHNKITITELGTMGSGHDLIVKNPDVFHM